MESILKLKQKVRKLEQLINILQSFVDRLGTLGMGSGEPGDASGQWYWDITGENLYFNPEPGNSTTWKLIS